MKRTAKRKFEAEPAHEVELSEISVWEELDDKIRAGWGETRQDEMPANWREVQGPNPWPSPFVVSSPWRKRGRKR